jgi:hypothetical protein
MSLGNLLLEIHTIAPLVDPKGIFVILSLILVYVIIP